MLYPSGNTGRDPPARAMRWARHLGLELAGVPRARARPMQFARGRLLRLELRLEEPGEPGLPTTREVVVFEEGAGSGSGPPRYLGLSLQEPLFQE